MSVTPADVRCFSHHGDWTGTHRREAGCPEPKWFINEEGNVYDYAPEFQAEHFPNDDHRVFDTQDEAELAAAISAPGGDHETDPDPAGGAPVSQMSYKEALDYAIFCMNSWMHPDASSEMDIDRMEARSDEIIATLVDIRETVLGQ